MSMRYRVLGSVLAAIVIVGAIVYANRSYTGYSVRVLLADAGGLQGGSNVSVGGVAVGTVSSLDVDRHDDAVATVHLNSSVVPLGAGAHATVEIDGFFGERVLLLTRGDYQHHAERSGFTIPTQDSGVSVRLDDVVDSLDMSAQGALQTFLNEQGTALVGRGKSLSSVLAQLPQTLPALTTLLSQFSANQQALGDLVDRSNRVVAEVAAQRQYLGQEVNSANGALSALASRRNQLGQTVQAAPGALRQAQTTLATLQGAAIPLAPAADGLRATAPSLVTALHQIPRFANAAVPTLNEVATVSPALQRLSDQGTPIVRATVPLTNQLTSYTRQALSPLAGMLANKGGAANLFGLMEGWARSTQGYDASSHIFRFGATVSLDSFKQLLSMLSIPGLPPLRRHTSAAGAGPVYAAPPSSAAPAIPAPSVPVLPAPVSSVVQPIVATLGTTVGKTLSGTVGGAGAAATKVVGTVTGALHLGTTGKSGAPGSGSSSSGSSGGGSGAGGLTSLLNYILGR